MSFQKLITAIMNPFNCFKHDNGRNKREGKMQTRAETPKEKTAPGSSAPIRQKEPIDAWLVLIVPANEKDLLLTLDREKFLSPETAVAVRQKHTWLALFYGAASVNGWLGSICNFKVQNESAYDVCFVILSLGKFSHLTDAFSQGGSQLKFGDAIEEIGVQQGSVYVFGRYVKEVITSSGFYRF